MRRAPASAKINLALVVGPRRTDGKHEVVTVLQRVALADRVEIEDAPMLEVGGFRRDTIVRAALAGLAAAAGVESGWKVRLEKRIPVAAGLGGGSSDAAVALRLANETLEVPYRDLHALGARIGADVPFFLTNGPQLGSGDGSALERLELPQDYWVVLVLPAGAVKSSTADVYARFDARDGARGYDERRAALLDALADVARASDLARLPPNDLVSSPFVTRLREAGAFRADVTGAGPAVYGLFRQEADAAAAAHEMRRHGRVWITAPAWYR